MTRNEMQEVTTIASGVVTTVTGIKDYASQQAMMDWMYISLTQGILQGEIISFGGNALVALRNLHIIYRRHTH